MWNYYAAFISFHSEVSLYESALMKQHNILKNIQYICAFELGHTAFTNVSTLWFYQATKRAVDSTLELS